MATFYRGYRNVLKGRSGDEVNPYTGETGTYSNWSIFNTSNVLDGFPDRHVEPGAGDYPHDVWMSRRFRGLDTKSPMDDPGEGARLSYHRTHPFLYKGLDATQALADAGHEPRRFAYTYSRNHTTHFYMGVPSANPLLDAGHGVRAEGDAGTANTFGRFNPSNPAGRTEAPLADADGGVPEPGTVYGFEHVGEWFGVPSARAL